MTLPPLYRSITVESGIRAAANRTPRKVALIEGSRRLDYTQLVGRIDGVAAGAVALGLRPGEAAAIVAPNCLEYIEIVCGLAYAGVAAATPSPRLTAPEIGGILGDCGARVVFAAPGMLEAVRSTMAPGTRVIAIGPEYEDWLGRAHGPPPTVGPAEWDVFSVPYTSGTTGKPKGVMLPHRARALLFGAMAVEYGCYTPDDYALAMAPMCHGAGLAFAMAPVFFGGTCEILTRFEPEALLKQFARTRTTNLFLVPTHLQAMLGLPSPVLGKLRGTHALRTIICNAAPLAQATKLATLDCFGDGLLHETYGSTEVGIATNLRPVDQRHKERCVGLPFPHTELRLLDEAGAPAPVGEVGELFSRSPFGFNGYWNKPAESAACLRGQWVTAGDLARQDEDGFYYIVDRKKDLVISGGLNIYPREIEEVLFAHPAVADAAVVGVPDAYWGEALRAFVVARPGHAPTAETLEAHCRESLAGFKIPHAFVSIDALPRNTAGKVLKTALRQMTE